MEIKNPETKPIKWQQPASPWERVSFRSECPSQLLSSEQKVLEARVPLPVSCLMSVMPLTSEEQLLHRDRLTSCSHSWSAKGDEAYKSQYKRCNSRCKRNTTSTLKEAIYIYSTRSDILTAARCIFPFSFLVCLMMSSAFMPPWAHM